MRVRLRRARLCSLAAAAACLLAGGATAQGRVPAGQVTGTTLKVWLEQKFTYAGIHHPTGCHFLAHSEGSARALYMTCPDGTTLKRTGTAEVKGNQWCTKFGPPLTDECVTWHRLGDGKFEQRRDALKTTLVYVLSVLPGRAK